MNTQKEIDKKDKAIEILINALIVLIQDAEMCDSWESFPQKYLNDANDSLLEVTTLLKEE